MIKKNDFMNLYGHQKNRKFDINKTLFIIYEIFHKLKENSHIINKDKCSHHKVNHIIIMISVKE